MLCEPGWQSYMGADSHKLNMSHGAVWAFCKAVITLRCRNRIQFAEGKMHCVI